MLDAMGELCCVFNGEIYNFQELRRELEEKGHIFRSRTDTEVILAAYCEWGTDCLKRFNGMFAFGLYDAVRRRLFLARDRAGEKPLYYSLANGALRFASEMKALMADPSFPRHLDAEALECYLAFGFVPGERCILQGTRKLPPAHALTFDLESGKLSVWQYWQLPPAPETNGRSVDEFALLFELEQLLEDAVRRQLVADVPVGVLLSGGVDSSLITAMAVRASRKLQTFTIRFPGYGRLDETEHARLIARHFDIHHVELEAQPTSSELLPRLARQFDEPVVDSSMIPTFLVSQLVRQHCTVALGGDGGDELFAGYEHYRRLLWMQVHLEWVPHWLRAAISIGAKHFLPVGLKGRNWLQASGVDFKADLPLIAASFDVTTRQRLMVQHPSWPILAETVLKGRVPRTPDLLQRASRMDFFNYLAEDLLVKVDRASMLNSLEVRAPMLDYRLIEFAFAKVPSHLKASPQDKKILLKRLAARVLPPAFDLQRKQGFSIPLGAWLKAGSFRELFHEVLLESNGFFDQRTVRGLLQGQDHGRRNGERLFGLVMFELWRREYGATL
jgi:asparagine synthase (glutamine-hydrolysing)